MSAFTGPLTVTAVDEDLLTWRLEQPLLYEVGSLGSGRVVLVRPGYVTDAASIPAPLRGILPAWGRWSRAAILHDYLYDLLRDGIPHKEASTRAAADAVFHEAMLVSGVPRALAGLMWVAVRLFGAGRARKS